jgi:tRNA nucleotidyltransferase/poly(A) polymerase
MNYLKEVNQIIEFSHLEKILEILSINKKEVYFIGGATRSILSNSYNIKDIDLVIPDLKDEIIEKISNEFNAKFYSGYRSLAIIDNNFEYQINSFRRDIRPTGRHTKVAKALTLEEDSKRRDFTFNSIYINLLGEAFDLYDGISHFKNSYLKFIFDPIEQIQKDYLRAIRFMRFLSLFENTKISDPDLDAIILLSKNITEFVKENKISSELKKIYTMPYPKNTISFLNGNKELNKFLDYL